MILIDSQSNKVAQQRSISKASAQHQHSISTVGKLGSWAVGQLGWDSVTPYQPGLAKSQQMNKDRPRKVGLRRSAHQHGQIGLQVIEG